VFDYNEQHQEQVVFVFFFGVGVILQVYLSLKNENCSAHFVGTCGVQGRASREIATSN
jgi:hypothetical protein